MNIHEENVITISKTPTETLKSIHSDIARAENRLKNELNALTQQRIAVETELNRREEDEKNNEEIIKKAKDINDKQ